MRAGTIVIERDVDASIIHPVSSELHNLIRVGRDTVSADSGGGLDPSSDDLRRRSEQQERLRGAVMFVGGRFACRGSRVVSLDGSPDLEHRSAPQRLHPAGRGRASRPTCAAELAKLRTLVGDRRLVLFMPTFRNAQSDGYYRFSADEIAWLDTWLRSNNCVLGVREHVADSARLYSAQLSGLPILDLSDAEFFHPELLYRESAALITDYSSAFIDYLLTGKPAISFAYDYEFYLLERGGFYDLDFWSSPDPSARTSPICRPLSARSSTASPTRRTSSDVASSSTTSTTTAQPASPRRSVTSPPSTASGSGRTSTSPDTASWCMRTAFQPTVRRWSSNIRPSR